MSTEQERPAEEPADADDTTSAAGQAGDSADGAEEGTGQDDEGSPGERLRGWFAGRLPAGWFTAVPMVQADREEITVIGTLPDPETAEDGVRRRARGRRRGPDPQIP